jgi:hypothetical protein
MPTPTDIGTNATTGTAVSSLSITTTSAIAAGDLILVAIANHNSAAVVPDSVTDSAGNTYTLLTAANSSAVSAALAYCSNATALPAGGTITVSYSTSRHIAMRAYTVGTMATSAFDVSAANAAGSGTSASVGPSATTSQADALVVAVFGYQNSRTFTAGSGYTAGMKTETATTVRGVVAEWKTVAATGAQTADGTWSASTTYAGVVGAFKVNATSAKSATDSVALSEGSGLSAVLGVADSAALSEGSSLSTSSGRTESASASDSSALAATLARTDAGALSESASAVNLGTVVSTVDTGTGSDTSSLAASLSPTESGALSEIAGLVAGPSRVESGTLLEAALVGLLRGEAGILTDASSVGATLGRTDGGSLSDGAVAAVVIILTPWPRHVFPLRADDLQRLTRLDTVFPLTADNLTREA